jgi:hypothetical protein
MNSLLLGLALSSSPTTAAQPPLPPALPPGTPLTAPYRPGYANPYQPTYNPYQPGYPRRPTYYPPTAPPFAPGEPTPGFPAPGGHHEPMTLAHFAKCFRPTPGHHTVCLIHPVTCRPVHVCFDLPFGCGCPEIDVNRRSIEFDYGKREIEIEFRRNGTYEVDYD